MLVAIVAAGVVVGASAGVALPPSSLQHARELLSGILEDVDAIFTSFSAPPDDPKSPVTNPTTLGNDGVRLSSASRKAQDLAAELNRLKDESSRDGR